MRLLLDSIMNKEELWNTAKQFLKFGIVGISNTFISLFVYYGLIYFGVNYIVANTLGFIVSVINAYYWNKKYVFSGTVNGNIKPFIKSFISYGMTFLLSTFLLAFLVDVLGISKIIAPLINLTVTIPLNFLLNKFWTFKQGDVSMTSKELAWKIRRHAVEMTHISNGSHIGAVLSIADIMGVLYNDVMKIFPDDPKNDKRDRFILSKGHAGAAVYAALAEKGFFETDILKTHYGDGSILSGHVSHKNVPGVEFSTGSLGHGACVAAGMAMAGKSDKKDFRVFVVTGDGECDEGSVWEMALFANHFRLSNLTVIVDHNKIQSLDRCEDTLELIDLAAKWKVFGWNVIEINGHDHDEIRKALLSQDESKPTCIIAHTIKGKGISFMEDTVLWHYRAPQGADYENAVKELEEGK